MSVRIGRRRAEVTVPAFRGLRQYGGGWGEDASCAQEAVNAYIKEGALQPMAACIPQPAALPAPMETLALLHRRWNAPEGQQDLLVAGAGGRLYRKAPQEEAWVELPFPEGVSAYQCSEWSTVSYEINPGTTLLTAENPVDVLLLSNAKDGMVCFRPDSMTVTAVPTPKRFGVIERHAERIWGGAIEDDPDMLVYSAPYDPFRWEADPLIPEDGAGDIQQPGWDGDRFTALKTFGGQLIAFKRNRVWRILGTNPGEYAFLEQYGGGTACEKTVAVYSTLILMLGRSGMLCYNGETVAPFRQEDTGRIWERLNLAAIGKACGCVFDGTYYLALPLDGSAVNNAVLMYGVESGVMTLRGGISVERFLPTEDALYFTSAETPGKYWLWREDASLPGAAAEAMSWTGPWMDLGYMNRLKGGFTLYASVECESPARLNFTVETERGSRTRSVTALPPPAGKKARQREMAFGIRGRRFRVRIAAEAGAPWRIAGGMQLCLETEED